MIFIFTIFIFSPQRSVLFSFCSIFFIVKFRAALFRGMLVEKNICTYIYIDVQLKKKKKKSIVHRLSHFTTDRAIIENMNFARCITRVAGRRKTECDTLRYAENKRGCDSRSLTATG